MSSPWWLLVLLFIPGLFGLALFMNWLEVYFTHQLVAEQVAVAWQSSESIDDLELTVGRIVERVMRDPRSQRSRST